MATESVRSHNSIYPGSSAIASVILELGSVNEKCVPCPSIWGQLVTRHLVRFGSVVTIVIALAVIFYEARPESRHGAPTTLPERPVARAAVEKSLARWRDSLENETKGTKPEQVVFVDQRRQPGQRLRAFAVLGDYELENCRCFKVKLDLSEPEASTLVVYYVFGRDPMWVYRAEDFDRIMHWEMDMPKTSKPVADPGNEAKSKTEGPEQASKPPATGRDPLALP